MAKIKQIAEEFDPSEIAILVEYVEGIDAYMHSDNPACGCCESQKCPVCAWVARRMAWVLCDHGYPHGYRDSDLDAEAFDCAEQLYGAYCAQSGHKPERVAS